jgi:hypothetical protein
MGETATFAVPAIEVPDHITGTPAGAVRMPDIRILENMSRLMRNYLVNY